MKAINKLSILICLACLVLLSACKKDLNQPKGITYGGPPPKTWQEHWGGPHVYLLKRMYYDADDAIYYDPNMDTTVTWPYKTMSKVWQYAKKTYGAFGDSSRLYVVLHGIVTPFDDPLGGGHPASYFDASHDYRNAIDCGLGDWSTPTGQIIGIPVHETGHIVCGANNGVQGSPSDVLWGDSKFMEIYIYDVLMNVGMQDEAGRVFTQMQSQTDNFPRANTQWFKNWFYPIYSKYGHAAVLSKYFQLLAANFPKKKNAIGYQYTRDLNWGEFIHFWSGATGVNLKAQATLAFGWSMEWEQELKNAQEDFPAIKYPY